MNAAALPTAHYFASNHVAAHGATIAISIEGIIKMTGEEHIVAWIESSKPHYDRLLRIAMPGNFRSDVNRAHACLMLAVNAYQDMVKCGDAYRRDHDAGTILGAALELSKWSAPE